MGVRGLSWYLNSKEADASWDNTFKLRDTRLVIDGGGLRCKLMAVCGPERGAPDARCGGQYTDYHARICAFFSELRKNGVRPLVILDGLSEPEKKDTNNSRAQQRVERFRKLSEWKQEQREQLIDLQEAAPLPLWANVVFVQALIDSKVAVVRTDYEADCSIAAVARHYKCPVLTADSDFFICDLPGGVVHLEKLDFNDPCGDSHSSKPILFRRSLFASALKRTRNLSRVSCDTIEDVLPLAATLSGNDFVGPQHAEQIEKRYYKHFLKAPPCFVRALEWLLKMKPIASFQERLSEMLTKLSADIHGNVKHSVEMYRPEECIAKALVQRCLPNDVNQLKEPFQIKGNGGDVAVAAAPNPPAFSHQPGWLMELFHLGLVAPLPFLRYENSLRRISPCLESFRHCPVSNIDQHLRSTLLGLVCQDKAMVQKTAMVQELVRSSDNVSLEKVPLFPRLLRVDEKTLSVENVSDVSAPKRRKVLLLALESGTESIAELDLTLQLPVATLRYLWSRMQAEFRRGPTPLITPHHLQVLLLGVAEACKSGTNALPCLSHDVIIPAMRSSLKAWYKGDELKEDDDEHMPVLTTECFRGRLDSTIVHIFNAWQRILEDVLQLNYALRMPFPTPFLHGLYNGVHNYQVFADKDVEDVFCKSPREKLATSLWQVVMDGLKGFEAASGTAATTDEAASGTVATTDEAASGTAATTDEAASGTAATTNEAASGTVAITDEAASGAVATTDEAASGTAATTNEAASGTVATTDDAASGAAATGSSSKKRGKGNKKKQKATSPVKRPNNRYAALGSDCD